MQFDRFDSAAFLRDHWQQQPLLIRNPWREWVEPLEADELAGLACEPGVEARLLEQHPQGWVLEHGPFAEDRFAALGAVPWTLLVQAVDQHVPQVSALIEPVRFIPDWRIDDVMVSYASDQGGVGPHFDQYDVFLVQGAGRRRWQIGGLCHAATPQVDQGGLALLADFQPTAEWVLGPGDILYLPPGIAHNGVALGHGCVTYSIGFRAPSRRELLAGWCDEVLGEEDPADPRHADPGLPAQPNPGEITPAALDALHRLALEQLQDRAGFARWFGTYTSAPKYPEVDWSPEEPLTPADLHDMAANGLPLCRNPASRFAFIRTSPDALTLFVDGHGHDCTGPVATFAETLCAARQILLSPAELADAGVTALVLALCNQGSLAFDQDD